MGDIGGCPVDEAEDVRGGNQASIEREGSPYGDKGLKSTPV